MVHDIEDRRQHHAPAEIVDPAIGEEDDAQAHIFKDQRAPFPEDLHDTTQHRGCGHVDQQRDHEKTRDVVDVEVEQLHHHEACEDHEDLPPRARHELQRIIKPVTAAQDHLLDLRMRGFKLRIDEKAQKRDDCREPAREPIDDIEGQVEPVPACHDQEIDQQGCPRPGGQKPAQRLRSPFLVDPLQLQRLVHCLVIMKPDGRQHGHHQNAAHLRELRCHRRRHTKQNKGHKPQHLFADKHDQGDHPNGKEARNFAHRVQPADVGTIKACHLDHEVIQKRRPRRKGHRHRHRHDEEKRGWPSPDRQGMSIFQAHDLHNLPLRPFSRKGERASKPPGCGRGSSALGVRPLAGSPIVGDGPTKNLHSGSRDC